MWKKITRENRPKEGRVFFTRIDDSRGVRNEARLIRQANLYFLEDMTMYVYYTPTHFWED